MSSKKGKGSKGGGGTATTRSTATVFDFDTEFPPLKQFSPPDKLPDYMNVVGMLRSLLEGKGQGRGVTVDLAAREVSKEILAKWFHDNVYHKSLDAIFKMVRKVHSTYIEGKRRLRQGKLESPAYKQLVELYEKKRQLFDVYPEQPARMAKCQEEWGGLRMTERDRAYYDDQKGPRLMVCENKCDPLFYITWLKEQRRQESREKWQQEKQELFKFRSLKDIKQLLVDSGDHVTDSEGEENDQEQPLGEVGGWAKAFLICLR